MLGMRLKIYVENAELKEKYRVSIEKHNKKFLEDKYCDAGFDLFVPELKLLECQIVCIDYGIKCEAVMDNQITHTDDTGEHITYPTGFYMYPRSSIYKTPLRMCNSVGIIDAGYRGNLKCWFDVRCNDKIEKFDRISQICSPGLNPIYVELVDKEEDLSITSRGSGGFGSTGK
jgi:dUTP pyrophosphatase